MKCEGESMATQPDGERECFCENIEMVFSVLFICLYAYMYVYVYVHDKWELENRMTKIPRLRKVGFASCGERGN